MSATDVIKTNARSVLTRFTVSGLITDYITDPAKGPPGEVSNVHFIPHCYVCLLNERLLNSHQGRCPQDALDLHLLWFSPMFTWNGLILFVIYLRYPL